MKLTLPRPYRPLARLTFHEGLALDLLRTFAGPDGIGSRASVHPVPLVAHHLLISDQQASALLSSLKSRRLILLTESDFAISSQLSKALKQERDRNRQRTRSAGTGPDWTLHETARRLFPCLRARLERPATYTLPAAFAPLLGTLPHAHKRECPPDVEILTEACYAGELQTVLTLIEEQRSARREPFLLYTRKALYVGVRRRPNR